MNKETDVPRSQLGKLKKLHLFLLTPWWEEQQQSRGRGLPRLAGNHGGACVLSSAHLADPLRRRRGLSRREPLPLNGIHPELGLSSRPRGWGAGRHVPTPCPSQQESPPSQGDGEPVVLAAASLEEAPLH